MSAASEWLMWFSFPLTPQVSLVCIAPLLPSFSNTTSASWSPKGARQRNPWVMGRKYKNFYLFLSCLFKISILHRFYVSKYYVYILEK